MKKKIPAAMLIGLIMLTAVAAFNISYIYIWNVFNNRLTSLNAREAAFIKLSEIAAYVDEYFINKYDAENLLNGAANGYIGALDDDLSYYIPADDVKKRNESDDFTGIGIVACQSKKYGGICIIDMYEGATAAEFGIHRLDIITEIDGISVESLGYEESLEHILGEEGTSVRLTVYREITNETLEFQVRRGAVINEHSVEYKMLENNIAYIKINSFNNGADTLFLSFLSEIKTNGALALIIDIRMNPGGYMNVMTNIADPLMGEGVIYSEVHKNGEITTIYSNEENLGIPIAVIVNEYTVGAGEYFASALQKNGCAKIVGQTTAGYGYAQSRIDLSDGAAIILSSTEYFNPEGISLQDKGVVPNRKAMMNTLALYELFEEGKGEDFQLNAAFELIRNLI